MKKFLNDNIPVVALVVFFLFILVAKTYRNYNYDKLPVVFVDSFTKKEKQEIRESIAEHIKTWESDFHKRSNWIRIEVIRSFPDGSRLSGQYLPSRGVIILEAGNYNETPALYHELCHLNITSGGDDHEASGWIYWNQRCYNISMSIARKRYTADPDLIPKIIPHQIASK